VWYYQHKNLFTLQPLVRPDSWWLATDGIGPARVATAAGLAVGIVCLLGATARRWSKVDLGRKPLAHAWLGVLLFGLMVGFGGVHAIAGGYAGHAGHNYVGFPLSLLFLGWLVVFVGERVPWLRCLSDLLTSPALVALYIAVGGIASWLVVGINRYEIARSNRLADFLVEHKVSGPVFVSMDPPLGYYWPSQATSTSSWFGEEWVLTYAMRFKQGVMARDGAPVERRPDDVERRPDDAGGSIPSVYFSRSGELVLRRPSKL
jgi:hypothetical protein